MSDASSQTVLPETGFDWLFVDFNSYFASVEQQENPSLRGRPVAVVPVETDSTCAIAASYEAKAFGVRTGTIIWDAKKLCPGLVCVPARHEVYVDYHSRILEELDRHVAFHEVQSIDEMACRLTGKLRRREDAVELAKRIKAGMAARIGQFVTCSAGISTNRFLAKVATDLQKPDGLVVVHPSELPGRFSHLGLRELPGIGANMLKRLYAARVRTIDDLWACPAGKLRGLWGGVGGERFWYALRGVELSAERTERRSAGHSHVLSPEDRPPHRAEQVARRLLLKAASRIRRMGCLAGTLSLSARDVEGRRFDFDERFEPVADSVSLLARMLGLWEQVRAGSGSASFKKVGVTLGKLVPTTSDLQMQLFNEALTPEARARRERLSAAMDDVNRRFGRDAVTIGLMPGAGSSFTGTKVAFNRVPERADFEEIRKGKQRKDRSALD